MCTDTGRFAAGVVMSGAEPTRSPAWIDRLATALARSTSARINRRTLGSAGALSLLAGGTTAVAHLPVHAQTGDDPTPVLDDAMVAEGLLVTLLALARTRASELELDDSLIRMIRAAQCEDAAHYDNLGARGGSPPVATYTIDDAIFANATSFLATWGQLLEIMTGMYMCAARQTAIAAQPDLVEIMFQIGTVEAQHVALLNQANGNRIPADRAFPAWQFRATSEAIDRLRSLKFIDGSGTPYDYPGPGDRYCRGVTGLVAETTSDQTPPDITAAPAPTSTPAASPAVSPSGSAPDQAESV